MYLSEHQRPTRESFIRSHTNHWKNRRQLQLTEGLLAVTGDTEKGPCLAIWQDKQTKPYIYCRYGTTARRAEAIAAACESWNERRLERAARRAKAREFRHALRVGDILSASWGYDQTNVDFFEVVRVPTDKTVVIREIASRLVAGEESFMCGRSVPIPGDYKGEPMIKRVTRGYRGSAGAEGRNNAIIKIKHYIHADLWDGKPLHCSWYA